MSNENSANWPYAANANPCSFARYRDFEVFYFRSFSAPISASSQDMPKPEYTAYSGAMRLWPNGRFTTISSWLVSGISAHRGEECTLGFCLYPGDWPNIAELEYGETGILPNWNMAELTYDDSVIPGARSPFVRTDEIVGFSLLDSRRIRGMLG